MGAWEFITRTVRIQEAGSHAFARSKPLR